MPCKGWKRLYQVGINAATDASKSGQQNKEQEKKWEKLLH